jgi:hypothetical protein
MKKLVFGNRLTPYLLVLCGLLLAILLFVGRDSARKGNQQRAQTPPVDGADVEVAAQHFRAPDIRAFSEILERPLFTEGREPPPIAESPAAAPPPRAALRLSLEGIAIADDTRVAVVRDNTDRKILRLAEGDTHRGWVVEKVHPGGATFKQGKQVQELTLASERDNSRKR